MQYSTICLFLDVEEFTATLTCHNDLRVDVNLTEINLVTKQTKRLTARRTQLCPKAAQSKF